MTHQAQINFAFGASPETDIFLSFPATLARDQHTLRARVYLKLLRWWLMVGTEVKDNHKEPFLDTSER